MNSLSMLALMLLAHLVADYTLQGCLANLKQKKWWDDQIPRTDLRRKYRGDYLVALVCHGLYWSLIVCLPMLMCGGSWYFWMSLANGLAHGVIDDMKANRNMINLAQDQALHVVQILVVWGCWTILR